MTIILVLHFTDLNDITKNGPILEKKVIRVPTIQKRDPIKVQKRAIKGFGV